MYIKKSFQDHRKSSSKHTKYHSSCLSIIFLLGDVNLLPLIQRLVRFITEIRKLKIFHVETEKSLFAFAGGVDS